MGRVLRVALAVAVRAQCKAFSAFKGLTVTVPNESRTKLAGVYRNTPVYACRRLACCGNTLRTNRDR